MAFSNPFDDPQGAFYILRNAQGQFSLWPQQCVLPAGWDIVCQPQSQASCQQPPCFPHMKVLNIPSSPNAS